MCVPSKSKGCISTYMYLHGSHMFPARLDREVALDCLLCRILTLDTGPLFHGVGLLYVSNAHSSSM